MSDKEDRPFEISKRNIGVDLSGLVEGDVIIFKAAGGNIVEMPIAGPLAEAIAEHKHLKELISECEIKLSQLDPKDWSHGIASGLFIALIFGVIGFCLVFAFAAIAEDAGTVLGLVVWVVLPVGSFIYAINNHREKNGRITREMGVLQQKKKNAEARTAELDNKIRDGSITG